MVRGGWREEEVDGKNLSRLRLFANVVPDRPSEVDR